jgi:hypothetical protein
MGSDDRDPRLLSIASCGLFITIGSLVAGYRLHMAVIP